MADDHTLLTARAMTRASVLLGVPTDAAVANALAATPAVAPRLTVRDGRRIARRIDLPSALVAALSGEASGAMLTDEQAGVLVRTVVLYALAVETFGSESMAKEWWASPISLEPGGEQLAPSEWAMHREPAAELVARMERTLHGLL